MKRGTPCLIRGSLARLDRWRGEKTTTEGGREKREPFYYSKGGEVINISSRGINTRVLKKKKKNRGPAKGMYFSRRKGKKGKISPSLNAR